MIQIHDTLIKFYYKDCVLETSDIDYHIQSDGYVCYILLKEMYDFAQEFN